MEIEAIGNMMTSEDIYEISSWLTALRATSFFNPLNVKIYEFMKTKVISENVIPGISAIAEALPGVDVIAYMETGGLGFRMEGIIKELRYLELRREIIREAYNLLSAGYNFMDYSETSELLDYVNKTATELIMDHHTIKDRSTADIITSALERVKEGVNQDRLKILVPYCHPVMDHVVKIFRKQIHSIGAFQGDGKTAIALDCLRYQIFAGMKVIYFCTESAADEIFLRMIANDRNIAIEDLLCGNFSEPELQDMIQAFKAFHGYSKNFWIFGIGDFSPKIDDMKAIAGKIAREHGQIDMIYLDFLQDLAGPGGKHMDERLEIAYNVNGFHALCGDLNCAGTMLCQFGQETHNQAKPSKKSFRGSGVIVDKSHIMSVIYSEEKDGPNKKEIREMIYYSVKTRLIKHWGRRVMFNGKRGCFTFPANDPKFNYADTDTEQAETARTSYKD